MVNETRTENLNHTPNQTIAEPDGREWDDSNMATENLKEDAKKTYG
ncbi:hypothetical protein [Scytonema sp. PCC 10023]